MYDNIPAIVISTINCALTAVAFLTAIWSVGYFKEAADDRRTKRFIAARQEYIRGLVCAVASAGSVLLVGIHYMALMGLL